MDLAEYDDIIRHLVAAIEHQRLVSEDLRAFARRQEDVNAA